VTYHDEDSRVGAVLEGLAARRYRDELDELIARLREVDEVLTPEEVARRAAEFRALCERYDADPELRARIARIADEVGPP
jgi:hypothetical protein